MYFLADFASYKNNIEINGLNKGEVILLNCEGYLVEDVKILNDSVFNNVNLYNELS